MARTNQKITLSASRDIPFNQLVLSQSNVRRVKAGVSIEELAADIARRTLLASLTVRPVLDDSGAETGVFGIPAGGRRYRALELLVKQKRLSRTAPVPCIVRTEGLAEEDSLAENVQRAPPGDVLAEARRFLGLPDPDLPPGRTPARSGSPEAARRLFAMGRPIAGTLAETYLRRRGITGLGDLSALRFHPRCYYWRDDHLPDEPPESWPALLARVTDVSGHVTGVHCTWLDPSGAGKAPLDPPRKAMGHLLGHGVRIGIARDVLAAGEGLETMLSLTTALPVLPVVAALSANHLAALVLPPGLVRLYIAIDADNAGETGPDRGPCRSRRDAGAVGGDSWPARVPRQPVHASHAFVETRVGDQALTQAAVASDREHFEARVWPVERLIRRAGRCSTATTSRRCAFCGRYGLLSGRNRRCSPVSTQAPVFARHRLPGPCRGMMIGYRLIFHGPRSPAFVTASPGLVWPGTADASPAWDATVDSQVSSPDGLRRPSSRKPRNPPVRRPPLRYGPQGCVGGSPLPFDRHRGRDRRGLETQERGEET